MAKKKSAVSARKKALEQQQQKQKQKKIIIGGLAALALLVIVVMTLVQLNAPIPEVNISELPVAAEVGSVAPDFELPAYEGGIVRLSDFRGQPVAVTFMHTW